MSGLIHAYELAAQINNPNLVILDCRSDLMDRSNALKMYQSGHIPGAQHVHLEDDLSGEIIAGKTGRHPLPDAQKFEKVLRRLGLSETSEVVVYDQNNSMFAVRAWWLLRWAGLVNVKLLNGGLNTWQNQGGELTTDTKTVSPSNLCIQPKTNELVSSAELSALNPNIALIDARALNRYKGGAEPLDAKTGHIPGAQNADFTKNLNADGTFLPASELTARFATLENKEVICYCGSGVTACHNIFAMAEAGMPIAKLYPGSWSEWITLEAHPIATGIEGDVL